MDIEARIAFINSQVLCAQAKLEGMKAANAEAARYEPCSVYSDYDFSQIPNEYGLEHNQVLSYLGV